MKKRGQIEFEAIINIIIVMIVFTAFAYAGFSYGNKEFFYKAAIARDLALSIDLIYALPGDIAYTYPNEISGYDIEIKENTVKVQKSNYKLDPTISTYTFAGIESDKPEFSVKGKKFVIVEKKEGKIKITGAG